MQTLGKLGISLFMILSLFSCVSGGDLSGMMGSLQAADQANNPRDETGNYIARADISTISFTPGSNFFTTFNLTDGDGIKKIEFKQVPNSVYMMGSNGTLRFPKEGVEPSAMDSVWELSSPGTMSGPASYQISANSQAAAAELEGMQIIMVLTDGKDKTQEIIVSFTKKM